MKKKEILLPEKRFKKSSPEELNLTINLTEEKTLLTNDDRDVILDVNKLFDKERNDSINYKLYGKMKMVFRNVYTGSTEYDYLQERLYINGDGSDADEYVGSLPYNEYGLLRNDFNRQTHEVYSGTSLSGFDGYDLQQHGSQQHQVFTESDVPKYNWSLYLSYVKTKDSAYPMTYTLTGSSLNFISGDGIPFQVFDDNNYYQLVSPVEHGMKDGEYIIIDGFPYYINSIGDEKYNSEKFKINILKSQVSGTTTSFEQPIITGKRCLNNKDVENTTSEYYIHKNRTITSVDDYIMDKVGFEQSIWEEERKLLFRNSVGDEDVLVVKNRMESILYDFKEPFILSGITNNLGYAPTELYLTVVFRNGNGYFTYPPKVGYKFNFHDHWMDEHFDGDSSLETAISGTSFVKDSITFTSGNTLPIGTDLIGNFIEYSPTEISERIVSETFHKFTTPNDIFDYGQTDVDTYEGASVTNPFGLYYQTHYKLKLRELSPYVETSNTPDIYNLPQNAKYFENEKLWKWRDLYDHGYIDDLGFGTDYPFMNNIHYVKNDFNFYLRNEQLHKIKVDGIDDFNRRNLLC